MHIPSSILTGFEISIDRLAFILWNRCIGFDMMHSQSHIHMYDGCSKWIAYFYLETLNFKLAQKCSFHALEVLPLARNAKFQPMYPNLEGVTVRWFGHSNKVLMNGRSKCLSGLVFPSSREWFQFRKQKEITWDKVWGIRWVRQNSYFFFLQKRRNYCEGMSWGGGWGAVGREGALSCRRQMCLKPLAGHCFW